ncbi:hypothetical protein MSHv_00090 [Mycoplasmopsis synoviae]|nr:hypothetical protein MSHv_00090 [Mycoplasmopsis synoviae]AQU47809.1 hypothetical protein ADF19_00090 [Mycoplasmopsis synoviae]
MAVVLFSYKIWAFSILSPLDASLIMASEFCSQFRFHYQI